MRKEVVEIYKFNELSEEAQNNAVKRWRDSMDWEIESEIITEEFQEELLQLGYPTDRVEWSLNNAQGDGVAFYGDIEDIYALSERLVKDGYDIDLNLLKRILDEGLQVDANIYRNHFGYHYSHCNTMDVELNADDVEIIMDFLYKDIDNDSDEYSEAYSDITNLLINLKSVIEDDVKETSKKLENQGYSMIEHFSSDKAIRETIVSNEYEFTSDGVMY